MRQLASTSRFKEIEKEHVEAKYSSSKENAESEAESDATHKACESTGKTDTTSSSGATISPTISLKTQNSISPEFSAGQSQPSGADLANSTYVKDFSRLVVNEVNSQSSELKDSCKFEFAVSSHFANF